MPIICPICQTTDSGIAPAICVTCGWSLSLALNSMDIEWVKQLWGGRQAAELRAKQAENAIADRQNQIDDCQSRIDLFQRRLQRLATDKEEALISARQQEQERVCQLEAKIAQLQQTLQTTEINSRQLQSNLHNQLGILQQVNSEKEQAQETARRLETEIIQIKHSLQAAQVSGQQLQADLHNQLGILQQQLQQITTEKEQAQETVRRLETEVLQMKHLLQDAEVSSQQLQADLHNQLDDHQRQVERWQQQLQQVTTEKAQALETVRKLEQEKVRQLETEVGRLKKRLQVVETANEQLETNLRRQQIENSQQHQALDNAKEQVRHLAQIEQKAQAALSYWLWSELFDRLITEIKAVTDRTEALNRIKSLQKKRLNQEWQNLPVHSHILQLVIELLERTQVSREKSQVELEKYHTVILTDAILAVRAELKYNLIIQTV